MEANFKAGEEFKIEMEEGLHFSSDVYVAKVDLDFKELYSKFLEAKQAEKENDEDTIHSTSGAFLYWLKEEEYIEKKVFKSVHIGSYSVCINHGM